MGAFPVYTISFIDVVDDKWLIDKSDVKTENGLDRGFVKSSLNSF